MLALALGVCLAVRPACAEVLFGARQERHASVLEFSRQGRFFSSSDVNDRWPDQEQHVRGRAPEDKRRPSLRASWRNDGHDALFGLEFAEAPAPNWPGQFDRFEDGVPLFDRAVVTWGEDVPAPGEWAAAIRTPDGTLRRIPVDRGRVLHPCDRSTIRFEPTPLQALFLGVRGGSDAPETFVEVQELELYLKADDRRVATNGMAVWHPGAYLAVFSSETPGMIEGLTPVNACLNSHHTLFYHPSYEFDLFFRLTPILQVGGQTLLPAAREVPVEADETQAEDRLRYRLVFESPGQAPLAVAVTATFRVDPERSLELAFRSDSLPAGARLGFRFHGKREWFGETAFPDGRQPGRRFDLSSAAGRAGLELRGAEGLAVRHLAREGGLPERVAFETLAEGSEFSLHFALPIGAAGLPQPALLNYAWRDAEAGEGDEGLAPFRLADLELLEEIDCGNPGDPHPCYDVSNDPVLAAARARGEDPGDQRRFGFLSSLENPQAGAVPVTTVLGAPVRALPARRGLYFRYDLQTRLKARTPYLVVVEHAFDQRRRGTFYSIALNAQDQIVGQIGQVLRGGFETSETGEGVFRTEAVLCHHPLMRSPGGNRDSLVFSSDWAWQGWGGDPGPAVRRIRLYKVLRMPSLPDLAPLLPPPERRRTVTVLSELCGGPDPWWLSEWPRLVGYDNVWVYHDPMSRLLGGSSNLRRAFHPGTLAGNRLLFGAAAEGGVAVHLHLGQLLNLGFGGGETDSFTGSFHGSYNGENVPFAPRADELEHLASAIGKGLEALADYASLREIGLADNISPLAVWTRRNLEDFCAQTGAELSPAPLSAVNLAALLASGPEGVARWQDWACARRRAFHGWLLKELRARRDDLRVVLGRHWYCGLYSIYNSLRSEGFAGLAPEAFTAAGIQDFADFLRLTGIDPALYAGEEGFSLELEADAQLRIVMQGPLDDYYETDWFRGVRDALVPGGLSLMLNYNYDEGVKPLGGKVMTFFKNRRDFRRGLVRALLHGNARNLTLPTYVDPWSGRIADLRQIAVPFRLLPYTEARPYEGTLRDSAGQAVIRRHGARLALFNAGDRETVAVLALPRGQDGLTDLSEGRRKVLAVQAGADGLRTVSVPMQPWSLKTLEAL